MPNRIIKDSIRTSKSVNTMSDFQFRLWAYLITYVDDYGRGSADPELLKGFVFPRRKGVTEATIQKTLEELATTGSVILYEVDGEPYLCFPNWSEHQTVRNKVSKFPAPENGIIQSASSRKQLKSIESKCSRNPIQSNPESGSRIRNTEDTRKSAKHTLGEYGNVFLTDEELDKLKSEFPDWEERVERLSSYIASSGKKYKNHLATIRNWARGEKGTIDNASVKPITHKNGPGSFAVDQNAYNARMAKDLADLDKFMREHGGEMD